MPTAITVHVDACTLNSGDHACVLGPGGTACAVGRYRALYKSLWQVLRCLPQVPLSHVTAFCLAGLECVRSRCVLNKYLWFSEGPGQQSCVRFC